MTTPLLAMHMANELLSIPVAGVTLALAAAAMALAARWAGRNAADQGLPLMGVMGAFVFAAQMVNFTVPLMPGTSGHLGGGVLLAILLGPAAAIVTMAAILIVQCLLFQDGGLLALGCNLINMGVVPCLLGWGVYRAVLGPVASVAAWRQYLAAWIACTVGVVGGAAMVPLESAASGVLRVPLGQFLGVMIGVHLVIGLCEGAITFAVIAYLRRVRPELVGLDDGAQSAQGVGWVERSEPHQEQAEPRWWGSLRSTHPTRIVRDSLNPAAVSLAASRPGYGVVAASLLVTALLLAGVISWFASTLPDGLEWSCFEHRGEAVETNVENDSPTVAAVDRWQSRWTPLSDYTRRAAPLGESPGETPEAEAAWPNLDGWRSLAGVLGTIVTLGVLYGASLWMRKPGHN
jgi:cobalt/nickel transport system permease protein